jgi:hypothetical protein
MSLTASKEELAMALNVLPDGAALTVEKLESEDEACEMAEDIEELPTADWLKEAEPLMDEVALALTFTVVPETLRLALEEGDPSLNCAEAETLAEALVESTALDEAKPELLLAEEDGMFELIDEEPWFNVKEDAVTTTNEVDVEVEMLGG